MLISYVEVALGQSQIARWNWTEENAAVTSMEFVRVSRDMGLELEMLPPDKNIALGEVAKNDFGQRVPLTDGEISLVASEWISNSPNVFGRYFTVDLGRNRAITRVRVRPGQTALNQPEYYVRGYRVEAALANEADIWRLLAEERNNLNLLIDTQADSTWRVLNDGMPISRTGQQVRFTITRQDRSNWVALGDIEVYAEGFEHRGNAMLQWNYDEPVNLGRVRWIAEETEGTAFKLYAKNYDDVRDWPTLYPMVKNTLFSGVEPTRGFEMRGELTTDDPFTSPRWSQLEVEYDLRLVAEDAKGAVTPVRVNKGKKTDIVYVIYLEINDSNYGVDRLFLDGSSIAVQQILVDGVPLRQVGDYSFSSSDENEYTEIHLTSDNRIDRDATVEVRGQGLFLNESNTVALRVGSADQERVDGYLNWQNGREDIAGSWTVKAEGLPGQLLSAVDLSHRQFSPFEDGLLEFAFVVSNLNNPTDVVLSIYDLNGNRVRILRQNGGARQYTLRWDGMNEDRRMVDPGLYLYEIEVQGSGEKGRRRGTCVVAY